MKSMDEVSKASNDIANLRISNLVHCFGELVAVDRLNAEVRGQEIVGLVGRNGAGKTTTMRAVMGILRPMSGEVLWHGHSVGRNDRMRFGYMPEERGLYPQMRILDQVSYFGQLHGLDRDAAGREARTWLERLGLEGRERDNVETLSHGNQQRVQLAVALVHQPELLVLDEPFAGLDPTAVDVLSGVMREEAQRGSAVIFSSHQLELVERLCDRMIILEEGRELASGSLAELQARFPRQLRVKVAAEAGWAHHLPGTTVLREDEDGVFLRLEPGADAQAVLRAAQAVGQVEFFGFEEAGLPDIYRQLVAGK
jgi:ABC-2 type transport system ATP-binding protein